MSIIKKLLGNSSLPEKSPHHTQSKNLLKTELGQLLMKIDQEIAREAGLYSERKASDSESYKSLKKEPEEAAAMARFLFEHRNEIFRPSSIGASYNKSNWRGFALFSGLMRSVLPIEPEEILSWLATLKHDQSQKQNSAVTLPNGQVVLRKDAEIELSDWPIGFMVQMIERKAKKKPLSDKARAQLRAMLDWEEMGEPAPYYGTDFRKVETRIKSLLDDSDGTVVPPYKKLSGDNFGAPLEDELNALPADLANRWNALFNLAATANAGRPTKKFLSKAAALKDELGKQWVRGQLQYWLSKANAAKLEEHDRTYTYSNGEEHTWTETQLFTASNVTLLKGLVWIAQGYQDAKTVNLIADLCEKSMRKLPGIGPAAQATANACLLYLEETPGAEATARLARLATAIKQKSVQQKVAAIVEKKAEAAGITTIQLEERVVPDYGLTNGQKQVSFEDYTLQITVEGPSKVSQLWIKPDGSPQKTKPKFVSEKKALTEKFNKVKAEVTALKKVLTAQRDRIDRMFAEDLEWPLQEIDTYYTGHGLMSVLATRLIWLLTTDSETTAAIFRNGEWQDVTGTSVATTDDTTVRLWHPIEVDTDSVMAWRARMATLEIVQPTKQAFREVYVLTDAERNTRVYSNRMAAHMLKQHQMASLMTARGWRYQLMGAYDDGLDDQWAYKSFVTSDLSAEYLIHTNWDEENWNDAGIYLYVGTDQLRFVRGGQPVALENVPQRLLSETMREADLFVGVASVGNDPAWQDQGPTPEARNYWQGYSFGTLDGFAETRKQVLETLLPRLKIRDVAHIDGKFLIVDGKLNTYKIHLGSSNILMAPGDRYLCIVPGGVAKSREIALPFEGDNRLSVILSKALMLADDDKITARDIVSQLKP